MCKTGDWFPSSLFSAYFRNRTRTHFTRSNKITETKRCAPWKKHQTNSVCRSVIVFFHYSRQSIDVQRISAHWRILVTIYHFKGTEIVKLFNFMRHTHISITRISLEKEKDNSLVRGECEIDENVGERETGIPSKWLPGSSGSSQPVECTIRLSFMVPFQRLLLLHGRAMLLLWLNVWYVQSPTLIKRKLLEGEITHSFASLKLSFRIFSVSSSTDYDCIVLRTKSRTKNAPIFMFMSVCENSCAYSRAAVAS